MKRHWQVLGVVVLVSLVVTSVLTGCGASPKSVSTLPGPEGSYAQVSTPAASPAADKGPGEAIQVHGRWTLEVTNPDGSVAERRDFENALAPVYGNQSLARYLGRQNSVGGWFIYLDGNPNAFLDVNNNPTRGILAESSLNNPNPDIFKTLTVDVPTSGPNTDKLVLSGTATAAQDGNISMVTTLSSRLSNSVAPSSTYGDQTAFTRTDITPLALSAGQGIRVTVVISFS